MEYSPKRIKMQVFPGDDIDASALVEGELAVQRLVVLYEIAGSTYLQIPNFRKHQRINRPNRSVLPPPNSVSTHGALSEQSVSERAKKCRKGMEGNGMEGKGVKPLCPNSSSLDEGISTPTLKSTSEPNPSPEAEKLATLLQSEILKNSPNFKTGQAQLRKWSRVADRMLHIDARTPDQIEAVIRWAQADEFWMSNVLSMDKVRKQFDQLSLKMQDTGARVRPPVDRVAAHNAAFLRRHQ